MRLANSPINWSNEDLHELGGGIPVEQCLREMREAGFDGTEYGYKMPAEPQECRQLLENHKLALVSSWHSFNVVDGDEEEELHALEDKCAFLKTAGATNINLCDTSRTVHTTRDAALSTRPRFSDTEWQRLATALNRAGALCRRFGLSPGYHHHMGTGVQTIDEVERLLAVTDPLCLGLCYDSGHALYAGDDPLELVSRFGDRISHVHFKDCREQALEVSLEHDGSFLQGVLDGVFTVPGGGMIDFAPIANHLKSSGYEGWIVVEAEQYPDDVTPFEFAQQAHAYLEPLVAE